MKKYYLLVLTTIVIGIGTGVCFANSTNENCNNLFQAGKYELAYPICLKEAKAGNSDAQTNLGSIYLGTIYTHSDMNKVESTEIRLGLKIDSHDIEVSGVSGNESEAIYWYQKAIAQNNPQAMMLLGDYTLLNINYSNGIKLLESAANLGYGDAQFMLAAIYSSELTVKSATKPIAPNFDKSIFWLTKYVETNNTPELQTLLGNLYLTGKVSDLQNESFQLTKSDHQQALFWLEKAANQDYAPAQELLGKAYFTGKIGAKDDTKAIYWLEKAASQKYTPAYHGLVAIYMTTGNTQKAFYYADKWVAATNSTSAKFILGELYFNGEGTEKNSAKGLELLSQAAIGGLPEAQLSLGDIYYLGTDDIKADPEIGIKWFESAAANNQAEAQQRLGAVYMNKSTPYYNYAKGYAYYESAAENGNSDAQVAMCYINMTLAMPAKPDFQKARYWCQKALANGNQKAQGLLLKINKELGFF